MLGDININVIEIYHPDLCRALKPILLADKNIDYKELKRKQIKKETLKHEFSKYKNITRYYERINQLNHVFFDHKVFYSNIDTTPNFYSIDYVKEVHIYLHEFRIIIAEIIKKTWDLKDLLNND